MNSLCTGATLPKKNNCGRVSMVSAYKCLADRYHNINLLHAMSKILYKECGCQYTPSPIFLEESW